MAEVTPLPAASVLLVRDDPFEVLMLRRNSGSSFMPDAWVFPGGIVERADRELAAQIADGSLLATMRIAAARETFEETGISLGELRSPSDLECLIWTSRWITPAGLPKRFDTWFFIARAPHGAVATPQESEVGEALWIAPQTALDRAAKGELKMVFPTLRNLEAIAGHESVDALIASRAGVVIEAIEPILVEGKPTLP